VRSVWQPQRGRVDGRGVGAGRIGLRVFRRRPACHAPQGRLREIKNEATFARNFEATSNPPNRKYQIITVFMIPMSEDRREGQRLWPNEYLEVFVVTAGRSGRPGPPRPRDLLGAQP
jgi:hypothetical protein